MSTFTSSKPCEPAQSISLSKCLVFPTISIFTYTKVMMLCNDTLRKRRCRSPTRRSQWLPPGAIYAGLQEATGSHSPEFTRRATKQPNTFAFNCKMTADLKPSFPSWSSLMTLRKPPRRRPLKSRFRVRNPFFTEGSHSVKIRERCARHIMWPRARPFQDRFGGGAAATSCVVFRHRRPAAFFPNTPDHFITHDLLPFSEVLNMPGIPELLVADSHCIGETITIKQSYDEAVGCRHLEWLPVLVTVSHVCPSLPGTGQRRKRLLNSIVWHNSIGAEEYATGFAKTFPEKPCVSQMLGGPSLRLGVTKECLNIPSGIG